MYKLDLPTYWLQFQGKTREEAEQSFMEVAVCAEERRGLNQEIREAACRNTQESESDSSDEWVDHSDMEEQEDEEEERGGGEEEPILICD